MEHQQPPSNVLQALAYKPGAQGCWFFQDATGRVHSTRRTGVPGRCRALFFIEACHNPDAITAWINQNADARLRILEAFLGIDAA